MRPTHAPARSSRLAGAAGALLLQGGFLFLFLASMPQFLPQLPLGKELTLALPHFRPLPAPALPAGPGILPRAARPVLAPAAPATMPAPILTPPGVLPGLQNFGQALNGCAPEKYASLPPDQKARCPRPGDGVAIQDVPNLMGTPSDVKDEAHWQAELARKKSPLWLPCVSALSINFICVGTMLANGSLTDPRSWPIYESKQLPPGDFYKIEQAYDAWHKDHPVSAPENIQPPG